MKRELEVKILIDCYMSNIVTYLNQELFYDLTKPLTDKNKEKKREKKEREK